MYQFTTNETVVNESGGAQSRSVGRADLLPPKALMEVAKVLGEGAVKYGEWNWKRIGANEHINHVLIHLIAHLAGDTSENHLVNATCRLMFAVELLIEYQNKLNSPLTDEESTYLERGENMFTRFVEYEHELLEIQDQFKYSDDDRLNWLVHGLVSEAGEVAELLYKSKRDGKPLDKEELVRKLGDVLVMLTLVSDETGYYLHQVADISIRKLQTK